MPAVKRDSESTLASQATSRAQRRPWTTPAITRLPMEHTEKPHHKSRRTSMIASPVRDLSCPYGSMIGMGIEQ
ncbi:MAG: hypothetical protein GW787_00965 [Betaproteobacteria bacterium]|nr:hypothetical protein [Betaproteobacteria bacterium]